MRFSWLCTVDRQGYFSINLLSSSYVVNSLISKYLFHFSLLYQIDLYKIWLDINLVVNLIFGIFSNVKLY